MTRGPTYCTILARNYLPKALALADSLATHHPEATLVVVLIDARSDEDLPRIVGLPSNVRLVSTEVLGLPRREVLQLAAIYDLVEFATSIKPRLFRRLLEESEQVVYLDPDTYVTAPMVELPVDLAASEGGILLTPHFLEPVPPGAVFTEGHLLTVGVFNLGFCGFDRRAFDFLDWWWGHLQQECLHDPLSGLFVDQKWVDIGSTLFHATAWQHRGYNVGVGNLHERDLAVDDEGIYVEQNGDRLRLFHFHAFDSANPDELTTRLDMSTSHLREGEAVATLCREYADVLAKHEQNLPPAPSYPYWTDTRGRRIARQTRRAYRIQSQAGTALPSPFVEAEADAFDAWRRRAGRKQVAKDLVGDAAKSVRIALPDEYARFKGRFPKVMERFRGRFVAKDGIWG